MVDLPAIISMAACTSDNLSAGTPEGRTVYVMTLEDSQDASSRVMFWNAVKGKRYDLADPLCTLKDIFYVVDKDNVWGNVQATQSIASTSFNFEDATSWRPLLTQKFREQCVITSPQQFHTVQSEIDWNRSPPKQAEAERIEQEFKSTIQTVIEHWRSEEGLTMRVYEGMNRRLYEVGKYYAL